MLQVLGSQVHLAIAGPPLPDQFAGQNLLGRRSVEGLDGSGIAPQKDGDASAGRGVVGQLLPGFVGERPRIDQADRGVVGQRLGGQLVQRHDVAIEPGFFLDPQLVRRQHLAQQKRVLVARRRSGQQHLAGVGHFDREIPGVVGRQRIAARKLDEALMQSAIQTAQVQIDPCRLVLPEGHGLLPALLGLSLAAMSR